MTLKNRLMILHRLVNRSHDSLIFHLFWHRAIPASDLEGV